MRLLPVVLAVFGLGMVSAKSSQCRCTPKDHCWSELKWNKLNVTVSGKLIRNHPPAISCYPGPLYDEEKCMYVNSQWSNTTFQSMQPIGYCYPLDDNCPAVDISSGAVGLPGLCKLGPSPVYTINATEPEHLVAGLAFARKNNVRLVVRNTGHDILGRSAGYGSLQIWMRYLRKGIKFQQAYTPSTTCKKCSWKGSAFTVAGGYVWDDVYQEAFGRDLTVVGGGDPTVGVIGGYIQGGGHSPAAHDYGLATDQILEARVILADGSIVTASPCSHPDLYFAIRGGGGGTYGVVISVTIKAYPSKPVVAHTLTIAPHESGLFADNTPLLNAITDLYMSLPALSDAGFSGYGSWSVNSPVEKYANSSAGYTHALAVMGATLPTAKAALKPVLDTLSTYNESLSITVNWFQFPSYGTYYRTLSGVHQATGVSTFSLASRLFDKKTLTSDREALFEMIKTLGGSYIETTINQLIFTGGGKVLDEPELSGANPAWRKTYLIHAVARGWLSLLGPAYAAAVKSDITYNKYAAMRKMTPNMGSYTNEADRNNPWWKTDYYGVHYPRLLRIKEKYDPEGLFYCPSCVGSDLWYEHDFFGKDFGPICRRN